MGLWRTIARPPWRTVVAGCVFLAIFILPYLFWQPGYDVTDGRHDLGRNAIWIQHSWLADDDWFSRNNRTNKLQFRSAENIRQLAAQLRNHHIVYVFPHLCPSTMDGQIAPHDHRQAEQFLDAFADFRVLPWVGGVYGDNALPHRPKWRSEFVKSVSRLLREHPRFAGIHLNIEPWSTGNTNCLQLLAELKQAMPPDKILSIAAYPPPTRWHPYPDLHWDEAYYGEVAKYADQIVVMMYDTALRDAKIYQWLVHEWSREVLNWSKGKPVLLGVPGYDDADSGYHIPAVENISNSLRGIHAALDEFSVIPTNYEGVALYSEWELDSDKWRIFRERFERTNKP